MLSEKQLHSFFYFTSRFELEKLLLDESLSYDFKLEMINLYCKGYSSCYLDNLHIYSKVLNEHQDRLLEIISQECEKFKTNMKDSFLGKEKE